MTDRRSTPLVTSDFKELLGRARDRMTGPDRQVIGVAGAPGAGKTTLVEALVRALRDEAPDQVALLPMDGFHLADVELRRLGRLARKGAPDTFDPAGYAAVLERVRQPAEGETVYAPAFDRELEQPVAGAMPVLPGCLLVLTEGNYLLLDEPPWQRARAALDEVWFCDIDDEVRRQRLVRRHVRFGKPREAAEAWVGEVDEPNAVRVSASRSAADVVVPGTVRLPQR